nr:translation initiation factor IF-2 [Oryctolagus cuniculus]
MSLPHRRPHWYPEQRQRASFLFSGIRDPVTPPPSPAWAPGLDPELTGGAAEGCSEEAEAWGHVRYDRGRALSRCTAAVPLGPAPRAPQRTAQGPRTSPQWAPTPSPPRRVGSPQPACRAGLGRRPSTQHGPQRAEDRQPGASGTAAAGGKEPEPSVHSLAARSRRSAEEPAPPLAVPPTWAGRRVPCRCAGDKSRGRGKLLVAASGKCQENFRKVALENKTDWKNPDELWRYYNKES